MTREQRKQVERMTDAEVKRAMKYYWKQKRKHGYNTTESSER